MTEQIRWARTEIIRAFYVPKSNSSASDVIVQLKVYLFRKDDFHFKKIAVHFISLRSLDRLSAFQMLCWLEFSNRLNSVSDI